MSMLSTIFCQCRRDGTAQNRPACRYTHVQCVPKAIQGSGKFAQSREVRSRKAEKNENVSNVPEMR